MLYFALWPILGLGLPGMVVAVVVVVLLGVLWDASAFEQR
jgi:hypothetical protein